MGQPGLDATATEFMRACCKFSYGDAFGLWHHFQADWACVLACIYYNYGADIMDVGHTNLDISESLAQVGELFIRSIVCRVHGHGHRHRQGRVKVLDDCQKQGVTDVSCHVFGHDFKVCFIGRYFKYPGAYYASNHCCNSNTGVSYTAHKRILILNCRWRVLR
jgi:hypothetical protein